MADVQFADFRDSQHPLRRVVIQSMTRMDLQPQDVGLGGGCGYAFELDLPLAGIGQMAVAAGVKPTTWAPTAAAAST